MQRIPSPAGATVSYDKYGSSPPLVLVHGSSSSSSPSMPSPAAAGVKRTRPKVTVWRMRAGMSWS